MMAPDRKWERSAGDAAPNAVQGIKVGSPADGAKGAVSVLRRLCARSCLRLLSRVVNFFHLRGLLGHRNIVRVSRRVLRTLRGFGEHYMAARCLCSLRQVEPFVFEEVVLSALEDAGFVILRNRSYSGDGGVDGAFWSPTFCWYAVQVKRYRSHIDRRHVGDFENAIRRMNFEGGVFVHTGRSGRGVYDLLRKDGIILVSGDRLVDLIVNRELVHWRM